MQFDENPEIFLQVSRCVPGSRPRYLWRLAVAIVSIFPVVVMAGCSSRVDKQWREEVRLHDDRIILVERYSQSARTGFPNSKVGNVLHQEIHYSPAKFAWVNAATEVPLSFDLMDGEVYFVTIPMQGRAYFCQDKPKGTYQANFYRWKHGQLERLSQKQAPVDRLRMNLSGFSQGPYSQHVTYLSAGGVNSANGILDYAPPLTLRQVFEVKRSSYLLCP